MGQLCTQDVERTSDGLGLKDGVSRDRVVPAHDPEMRRGRRSSSRRFDGRKASIVVDTSSQLLTAVEILPGYGPGNLGHWNWWNGATPPPVCRWRSSWATPLMATEMPGRLSPPRDAP